MKTRPFDRNEHVYENEAFDELVKDAVRFFNGTPVIPIPPPVRFPGVGVYALYYTGKTKPYEKYGTVNRVKYDFPIYVGKAVPKGWRQGRVTPAANTKTFELNSRLRKHYRTINTGAGLNPKDFTCRFTIFEGISSSMISTVESALIRLYMPLWNTQIDGFGNNDPGKGRYNQRKSHWDVLHPGREWAERCAESDYTREQVIEKVKLHMKKLK